MKSSPVGVLLARRGHKRTQSTAAAMVAVVMVAQWPSDQIDETLCIVFRDFTQRS